MTAKTIRRRAGAWTVLLALLFQVFVGPALARGMALSADGDAIVVCTAAGMAVRHLDGTPADGKSGAVQADGCVFCLPLMQGHLSLAAEVALVRPAEMAGVEHPGALWFEQPVPARLPGGAHPQAPPSS